VRSLLARESEAIENSARPERASLELAQDAPANLEWLNGNRAAYTGEWVALHKGRLVAHGKDGLEVFQSAQANPPLMHRIVQDDPISWGGW